MRAPSMVRQGAILLVFLANDAAGSRVEDKAATPLSSFGAICQRSAIWSELKTDASADEIMTINWADIKAQANAQLKEYMTAITNAKIGIKALETMIAEAKWKELVVPASEAEIDDLITKATEPYDGLAKETQCGEQVDIKLDRKVKSKLRRAFDDSVDKMGVVAEEAFKAKRMSLPTATFLDRCASLLGENMYCKQLCTEMRTAASSHAGTGAVSKSSDLLDKMEKLKETVATNEKNKGQCEEAMKELADLETVVTTGTEEINNRFRAVRRARADLRDAEDGLMDITDNLAEHSTKLMEVEKELDANKEEVKSAVGSLKAKDDAEKDLNAQVKKTDEAVKVLDKKLNEANAADTSVKNLINELAKLMTKMWLYFDDAALLPMRDHGIFADLDMAPYFFDDIKDINAAGPLNAALEGLDAFCTNEALPIFRTVKGVDLTPMCATGDVPSMKKSIYDTVESKVEEVRGLIAEAKSWTNKLKGQSGMTDELVAEYEKAGELEGLRGIVGVYQHSEFFKYLQGWKKDGAYLQLIALLNTHITQLGADIKELLDTLAKLKELAAAATAAREAAEKSLQEAQAAEATTDGEKAALGKAIAELEEEKAQADRDLSELQARFDKAEAALQAAKKALEESHKMAITGAGLLETMLEERLYRFGYAHQAALQ